VNKISGDVSVSSVSTPDEETSSMSRIYAKNQGCDAQIKSGHQAEVKKIDPKK